MSEAVRLPQPDLARVDIGTVLHALADPVRLRIVRMLTEVGEAACGALDLPVKPSTVTHHMRTLRESGLVEMELRGNTRVSKVRREELDQRFPGLLAAVLDARPAIADDPADPADTEGAGQ
ncbi:DNA-binding transcriptional ArsR family regulator [Amycolatopsis viridis]|uniref:DNA-binding transcriptional ArsR family regulator n=1 Tax=Amycolatopsis viridis TaxID=185678 RepID=A0ABX0SQ57_9PSEU|nr:metalloregulator ArsR/SmtB family transcription factor [Amycolatopsis viridis]NIH79107.1 DNA-binding transcriptional ArsR family regulator [Amycolatopsis viridis]